LQLLHVMAQNNYQDFFYLVRHAIGASDQVPQIEEQEWETMFDFAKKQAVLGIVYGVLQRMGKDVTIPRQLKMKWFFYVEKVKKRNILLNQRCVELVTKLRQDGFDSLVLKGQGNAMMYPNPFVRISGDIDIFMMVTGGKQNVSDRRRVVTDYVRKKFPHTRIRYQHIDYHLFPDVEVEIHFVPTFMNNPLYNHRIQTWMEGLMMEQCQNMVELPEGAGKVAVPTVSFNIVFLLAHMMRHFFDEGIGLRQFVDYYYLLQTTKQNREIKKDDLERLLRHLGLWKFAGAAMYVMQEVFALREEFMIAPVDDIRGKTLLDEILKGGNFGKSSGLTDHSTGGKYFAKIWRNLHFVRQYPHEALCEPVFRTWHFFWRLKQKS